MKHAFYMLRLILRDLNLIKIINKTVSNWEHCLQFAVQASKCDFFLSIIRLSYSYGVSPVSQVNRPNMH